TDITYIQYGSTTKYLSTIMDLFNNEIVAYKLFSHQQTPLIIETLKAALIARDYPKGVIIHSDQGTVYTSYAYQNLIKEHKDRKSTRLNSSHVSISYAVFCLKKKQIYK